MIFYFKLYLLAIFSQLLWCSVTESRRDFYKDFMLYLYLSMVCLVPIVYLAELSDKGFFTKERKFWWKK